MRVLKAWRSFTGAGASGRAAAWQIASGKAELANALHSLLARQRDLPVVWEVSAIPFHDLVKLGAKAFI